MSASVSVTLPYPPSTNSLWRQVRHGVIRSEKYQAWLNEATWLVKAAVMALPGKKGVPGPYALTVRLCPPDRRLRDLDNVLKALSDALKHGGAIDGDHLCQRIDAAWDDSVEGAFCCVMSTILKIPAPAAKAKRVRKPKPAPADKASLPASLRRRLK